MRISVVLRNTNNTPPKWKLMSSVSLKQLKDKLKSITESPQFLKLKSLATKETAKSITESPQFLKLKSLATKETAKSITESPQFLKLKSLATKETAKSITESPQFLKLKSLATKETAKSIMESPQFLRLKSLATENIAKPILETPQISQLNSFAKNKKQALYKRMLDVNSWYIKAIGLEEVKLFHDRVLNLQEQLMNTQGKRREVGRQLSEIRQRAMELQAQLQNINKHEQFDKYFALMKQEGDLVKLEKKISSDFQEYDQTERELFTAFTNAIRDSYEKQRAQVEYTKYFGLVLGIIASFLTFVYSTVKKYDLKKFIEEKLSTMNPISPSMYYELLKVNRDIKQDMINQRDYLASNKVLLEKMQWTNDLIIKEQTLFRSKLNEIIGRVNKQSLQQPIQAIPVIPEAVIWGMLGITVFAFLLGKAC